METSVSPIYDEPRVGDVKDSEADITKAKKLLGFDEQVSFKKGLKKTVQWFSENA